MLRRIVPENIAVPVCSLYAAPLAEHETVDNDAPDF